MFEVSVTASVARFAARAHPLPPTKFGVVPALLLISTNSKAPERIAEIPSSEHFFNPFALAL